MQVFRKPIAYIYVYYHLITTVHTARYQIAAKRLWLFLPAKYQQKNQLSSSYSLIVSWNVTA